MSQTLDLKAIEQTAFRDSIQDGLMELFLGIYLFFLSGAIRTSTVSIMVALSVIFAKPVLTRVKNRFTYPRIGYVEFVEQEPKKLLSGMLVFTLAVVAVVALILVLSGDIRDAVRWYRWTPIFFGGLMLGPFIDLASKSGLSRYYAFMVLSLASGVVFALLRFEGKLEGLSLHLLFLGVVIGIWGAMLFVRFLRRHPLPRAEATNGI